MQPPIAPTPVAPPPSVTPARVQRRTPWWILPLVLVVIGGLAWLVLAGLPFRGEPETVVTATSETIAEGTAPPATGTLIEVPGRMDDELDENEIVTTTTAAPPTATMPTATLPPPTATAVETSPPPPPLSTNPRPSPVPSPASPAPSREISESEATAVLRGYVTGNNYYRVAAECVRINSRGYRNTGYTFEVWHSCAGGGASRLLGRWRVDSKTRELFRQQDDGRYLRP